MGSYSKLAVIVVLLSSILFLAQAKKPIDPYKILGVDRSASQRDIQKAFHKLSLQYHPDKNKNKGAQQKFEEINNAYDILSDEQKRKNYDLYGDESGGPSFGGGSAGDGYSYFTGGRQGQSHFSFRPDGFQNMGGQGSNSFSFSFGGPGGGNPFGFGLNDMFSNLFGGDMGGASGFGGPFGSQFGGSRTKAGSQSGFKSPPKMVHSVNSQVFEKEINNMGITWLLLSYAPSTMSIKQYESILEEIANSLKGALKVGKVNCETEASFCKDHGIYPRKTPRLFIYSYTTTDGGSFEEYNDDWDIKTLKNFCQEHLPRYSKRVSLDNFEPSFVSGERLPRVLLLSTKKDTPVIWRVLSGLYHKRLVFFDAQVHDASDPNVKDLGVNALPAMVGWLSNGEKQILKAGISVKDLESAIQDLSLLLRKFEKRNKKVAPSQRKSESESSSKQIPHLTASNLDALCGEQVPVCLIGAFRSSKARDNLESILLMVSQKSLSRQRNLSSDSKDSISYALLDATKQQSFLNAFDKSGFRSLDSFLVAYKPRKGKFAAFTGDLSFEEAEMFIGSVLSGDVQFSKTRQKPTMK